MGRREMRMVAKPEGKRPLVRLRLRLESNIRMGNRKRGGTVWTVFI
jgi:hypothetical protein